MNTIFIFKEDEKKKRFQKMFWFFFFEIIKLIVIVVVVFQSGEDKSGRSSKRCTIVKALTGVGKRGAVFGWILIFLLYKIVF